MKPILLQLIALAVAGCCSLCPPKIIKEPVEVKVPVPVPCKVVVPSRPVWQMDYPEVRSAGLFVKGNSALIELEQRRKYEAELEALLVACTDPISQAATPEHKSLPTAERH